MRFEREKVTSVKVVENRISEEVAKGQAAMGGMSGISACETEGAS